MQVTWGNDIEQCRVYWVECSWNHVKRCLNGSTKRHSFCDLQGTFVGRKPHALQDSTRPKPSRMRIPSFFASTITVLHRRPLAFLILYAVETLAISFSTNTQQAIHVDFTCNQATSGIYRFPDPNLKSIWPIILVVDPDIYRSKRYRGTLLKIFSLARLALKRNPRERQIRPRSFSSIQTPRIMFNHSI